MISSGQYLLFKTDEYDFYQIFMNNENALLEYFIKDVLHLEVCKSTFNQGQHHQRVYNLIAQDFMSYWISFKHSLGSKCAGMIFSWIQVHSNRRFCRIGRYCVPWKMVKVGFFYLDIFVENPSNILILVYYCCHLWQKACHCHTLRMQYSP